MQKLWKSNQRLFTANCIRQYIFPKYHSLLYDHWSPPAKVVPSPAWVIAGHNENNPEIVFRKKTNCMNCLSLSIWASGVSCVDGWNIIFGKSSNLLFLLSPCFSRISFMQCLQWINWLKLSLELKITWEVPETATETLPHLKNAGSILPRICFAAPLLRQTASLSPRLKIKAEDMAKTKTKIQQDWGEK